MLSSRMSYASCAIREVFDVSIYDTPQRIMEDLLHHFETAVSADTNFAYLLFSDIYNPAKERVVVDNFAKLLYEKRIAEWIWETPQTINPNTENNVIAYIAFVQNRATLITKLKKWLAEN